VLKNIIKKILSTQDLKLSRVSTFECEPAFETQKRLVGKSNYGPLIIFDVGAFIGTISLKYQSIFPDATIFCFELFLESYNQLKINTARHPNIKTIPKALGNRCEKSKIF